MTTPQATNPGESTRRAALLEKLRAMTGPLLRLAPDQIDVEARFLEMGADSLVLIEAVRTIEETFGITLTIQQLFEDVTSLADLAAYLDRKLPPDVTVGEPAVPAAKLAAPAHSLPSPTAMPLSQTLVPVKTPLPLTALEQLFTQQLQIMAQQLELLAGRYPLQSDQVLRPQSPNDQAIHDAAPLAAGEIVEIEL
jgi:acyl carrier protein